MNNMDKMIGSASQKLGTTPEKLKGALEKGNISELLSAMTPADAKKLKTILENKTVLDKLMKSPQAAEIARQLQKKS